MQETDKYIEAVRMLFDQLPDSSPSNLKMLYEHSYGPIRHLIGGATVPGVPSAGLGAEALPPPPIDGKLVAVGIHGFHSDLPVGRMSQIYVCREHLQTAAARSIRACLDGAFYPPDRPDPTDTAIQEDTNSALARVLERIRSDSSEDSILEPFLALFNYCYANVFGRQDTLIHTLLERGATDGAVFAIAGDRDSEFTPAELGSAIPVDLRAAWDSFADPRLLNKLTAATMLHADAVPPSNNGLPLSEEVTNLYGSKLLAAIDDADNKPSTVAYCIRRGLRSLGETLAVQLRSGSESSVALRGLFERIGVRGANKLGEHSSDDFVLHAGRMLQLFLLYREFCGKFFYVVVPAGQRVGWHSKASGFRMCFTFGSEAALSERDRKFLETCSNLITDKVRNQVAAKHSTGASIAVDLWRDLLGVSYSALESRKRQIEGGENGNQTTNDGKLVDLVPGGAYYLRFAERLAQEAVHEGRKLRFRMVIGDGEFASRMLRLESALPALGTSDVWDITNVDDLEPIIALCRGNYSFLQRPGTVLYGNIHGQLLRLAQLLSADATLESVTRGQSNCAAISLTSKGGVEFYWGGGLLLTTHWGRFVVPRKYGKEYTRALHIWLVERTAPKWSASMGRLAEVVWSFSERGKGACFILGQWAEDLKAATIAMTITLPFAEGMPLLDAGLVQRFEDLAEQDGATIIDTDTGRVYGRRMLLPSRKAAGMMDMDPAARAKRYRWGSRHQSAYAFIRGRSGEGLKPAIAVVVSSDGDIHVIDDTGVCAEYMYPTPMLATPQT